MRVNNALNAAVLSLLLVLGQAAVTAHSIEHPYFSHKDSCTFCQLGQLEKSAVTVQIFIPPPCKQHFEVTAYLLPVFRAIRATHYHSRAPPAFS